MGVPQRDHPRSHAIQADDPAFAPHIRTFLQVGALLAYAFYLNWQVTSLGVLAFSAGALVLVPMLRWATALADQYRTDNQHVEPGSRSFAVIEMVRHYRLKHFSSAPSNRL